MKLYLISGPPGSGKTRVVQALLQQGMPILLDSYQILIDEQKTQPAPQLPRTHPRNFVYLCQGRMWKDYQKLSFRHQTFFVERGIPDLMALLDAQKIGQEPILKNTLLKFDYQKQVFFCPHWPQIYLKKFHHPQNIEEVEKQEIALRKRYLDLEYELVDLPFFSPEDRAHFILEALEK